MNGNEILTIRSREEGGRSTISGAKRTEAISYAINCLEPSFIDIEISTLRRYPFLLRDLERSRTKLIASFHDLSGKYDVKRLRKTLLSVPKTKSLFATKIVCLAKKTEDNLKILDLYSFNKEKSKLVAFCTGKFGVPSRILCLRLGAPYSYVSLPNEPVAEGQLDIVTMNKIVRT